ncbi:PREDICTED: ras-related protein Rab-32-like isoform X1 [Amphimedon queenslandica]|uniref:Ras-related protein Rab n=1 Tax=Amphimedon queenslandica TaxID=400682 RepID=A0AAN0IZB6_AMPQE|nr:PREDICTED: ras-related protein Rab-32-like isoform X1 [Amphimedon queenslandica]|eukprot:XP_019849877.1 PREDICTED: ras-related protein Rab-32-like isoform X1 [Amphimedon queenslandica]
MAEVEDEFCKTSEIKEILYKVLVVGNFGVGKTSVIRRYTSGIFSPHYKLTIGVDFALKTLIWDEHTKINMQLWDIAGHERFGHMTRVYYKYAIAAIIVFDLTRLVCVMCGIHRCCLWGLSILIILILFFPLFYFRQPTFDAVQKWLDDVRQKVVLENDEPVPVLLLANKCDLDNTTAQVDQSKLDQYCEDHNLIGWFPTSAKDNTNIEEAMSFLIEKIMQISSIQIRDSTPFDDLNDIEQTDTGNGVIGLESNGNGHLTSHQISNQTKANSGCCA